MRYRFTALSTALAALALAPAADAAPNKASIAVAPFTFHHSVRRTPGTDLETGAFTKKFITALGKSNKFDVVERDNLDTLFNEMKLSDAGFTDPARAVKAGKLYGVDFFLMGEVSVWTVTSRTQKIPRVNRYRRVVDMTLIVDMRIVNARTSKIVSTEKGEVTRTWQSGLLNHVPPPQTRLEPATTDEIERELCNQLVKKAIDVVYPLKVLKFNTSSGIVFVNRGQGGGIHEGNVYDVFQPGEAMIDPDTGENLGTDETKVGRIRIREVLAKFSKAELVAGSANAGYICRAARGEANFRSAPPPPPADTTPPVITLLAPGRGQTLNTAPITIAAEVRDDTGVARVQINGVEAAQDDKGRYRVQVSRPNDGRNGVLVRAWDVAGNAAEITSEFTFDSTPPQVQAEASILVEGTVDDLDCTLTINGAPVRFDPKTGAYSVRVKPDPAHPTKVVVVATDEFGNKTTEVRNIQ